MPQLVAHRGQNADYPENTLESLQAAIDCGARFLEIDLQLTSDLIPILCHDATLERTSGENIDVRTQAFSTLLAYSVDEAQRLQHRFSNIKMPSLEQALAWLSEHPQVQLFIELKQESFDLFGIEAFVDRVLACLEGIADQCIMISFNREALVYTRQQSSLRIGWVIRTLEEDIFQLAEELQPEFMFINHLRCQGSEHEFSADPWDWVLYETSEAEVAEALFRRGVSYVETNDIRKLLPCFND